MKLQCLLFCGPCVCLCLCTAAQSYKLNWCKKSGVVLKKKITQREIKTYYFSSVVFNYNYNKTCHQLADLANQTPLPHFSPFSFIRLRTNWLSTIYPLPNHLSCSQSGWQHGSTLLGLQLKVKYTGLRRANPWTYRIDMSHYIITGTWEQLIWKVRKLVVTWQSFTGLCWHLQRFSRAPVDTAPTGKAPWSIHILTLV